MIRPGSRLPPIWTWFALWVTLAAICVWLLSNGYLNEGAMFRWARITTVLGAPDFRLENFSLLYPHLPIYLLAPFYVLPGFDSPFAPYLASSLVGALLLMLWYYHLRLRHYPRSTAVLLVMLVAAHPLFLWVATSGTEKALSLLMFYAMCFACVRLLRIGDVRSIIMLGSVLALYFFVDERTIFLFLALLPLLAFLAPMRMLRASLGSAYVLISLPIVISILAWIYLNWLFEGDPWIFLTSAESAFVGASRQVQEIEWLREFGGRFFASMAWTAMLAVIALPALLWTLWHLRWNRRILVGMGILAIHPVLATAIATQAFFLDHPVDMIFLMLGACMASLLLMPKSWARNGLVVAGWFLASAVGGWIAFAIVPGDDMQQWRSSLVGTDQGEAYAADERVGLWLAVNRQETLIDSRAAYRVVVARGDAKGLVLPFMPDFKVAERLGSIEAKQVVVIDPRHRHAARDRITQRFLQFYDDGQAGYRLVVDDPPWRVYRRADLRAATN